MSGQASHSRVSTIMRRSGLVEGYRFRNTRKKIGSNDTSEHDWIYFFFHRVLVLEGEWNLRGNLCLVFSFFFNFRYGRWPFDRSRNLRCFRALADFEACCAPELFWWPIGRHMTRTLELRIATCLQLFLFRTILKFFAIFLLLFPLRFSKNLILPSHARCSRDVKIEEVEIIISKKEE